MIKVNWEVLSSFLTLRKKSCQMVETETQYHLFGIDGDFSINCTIDKAQDGLKSSEQIDFEDNFKDLSNKELNSSVTTRFERDDIRLQIVRASADVVNGLAEISLKLPGTPGVATIFLAGGWAISDVHTFGDAVTGISVVDVDNILGYGAHTVIATYHHDGVAAENKGWYMWPSHQNCGEMEIESMGFYGEIPAGLYLELYFSFASATKVLCDFEMGVIT